MIVIKNVSKCFIDGGKKRIILSNTYNEFKGGEKIGLVGRSGLGKSTILKLLLGIEKVDEGDIIIDGLKITDYNKCDMVNMRRKIIGCVFQNFNLISNLTVEENILLPTYFYNNNHIPVSDVLDKVDLPSSMLKQSVNTLSGGEKQRVSIARALINSPKVLIADEPTGNLDLDNENKVIELFTKISKDLGLTIITVTHSENVAKAMDKIYTIEGGKIVLSEKVAR